MQTALREADNLDALKQKLAKKEVTEIVVDLAQESLYGAIANLYEPIRPLKDEPVKKPEQKRDWHIFPHVIAGLRVIITDLIASPAEICKAMDDEREKDLIPGQPPKRKFQPNTANFSLRKGIGLLENNIRRNSLNDEERELVDLINECIRNHGMYNIKDMHTYVARRLGIKAKPQNTSSVKP